MLKVQKYWFGQTLCLRTCKLWQKAGFVEMFLSENAFLKSASTAQKKTHGRLRCCTSSNLLTIASIFIDGRY